MTWLLILGWLCGAGGTWLLLRPIASQSASGRCALLPVAIIWPVVLVLAAAVGVVALVENLFELAMDEIFGEDREPWEPGP